MNVSLPRLGDPEHGLGDLHWRWRWCGLGLPDGLRDEGRGLGLLRLPKLGDLEQPLLPLPRLL